MSKFKVGDKVQITSEGKIYITYSEWMEKNALKYYALWKASGFGKCDGFKNLIGKVLVCAPHCTDRKTLYCVMTDGGTVLLIGEDGLKLISAVETTAKYKPGDEFNISGKVKILGVQINKAGQVMYQTDKHFTIYETVLDDMKAPTVAPKEPAEHSKPEPVKLYCTKDYRPGEWLTRGKVYEFKNGSMTYDDGFTGYPEESYEAYAESNRGLSDHLCKLVRRPAKVGEWVYIDNPDRFTGEKYRGKIAKCNYVCGDDSGIMTIIASMSHSEYLVLDGYVEPAKESEKQPEKPANLVDRDAKVGEKVYIDKAEDTAGAYKNGDICEVVEVLSSHVYIKTPTGKTAHSLKEGTALIFRREYLVVEPANPVYYSGTTVCISPRGGGFTVGKTYKFKDGITTDDDSDKRPVNGKEPIKSLYDDWANGYFIEFKG